MSASNWITTFLKMYRYRNLPGYVLRNEVFVTCIGLEVFFLLLYVFFFLLCINVEPQTGPWLPI